MINYPKKTSIYGYIGLEFRARNSVTYQSFRDGHCVVVVSTVSPDLHITTQHDSLHGKAQKQTK